MSSSNNITKPPLKWVGGKSQIIDKVLDTFPKTMQNYHEPFLGGGSVLLAVLSRQQSNQLRINGQLYASDLNPHIIAFYTNIQRNLDGLLVEISQLVDTYNGIDGTEVNRKPTSIQDAITSQESYYYWIRSQFNSIPVAETSSPKSSAMFLFLNKTGFRGVYREGPNGYNVPYGNYKNPSIYDESHLRKVSELIQSVVFTGQPFIESLRIPQTDDFVYLDPPYAPENSRSFVKYNASGFNKKDHDALFSRCAELSSQSVQFVLSNADVEMVRVAFPEDEYKCQVVDCRRSINSKNPESRTNEIIISNF